ncbi:MAG: hypothetical protein OIF40_11525 [Mangrovicoccus sp.]|nr:hypothetical protein [Mangrovicoccus sp.]
MGQGSMGAAVPGGAGLVRPGRSDFPLARALPAGYGRGMNADDPILLKLSPSPARRFLATAVQGGTGGMLVYVALNAPQSALLWQAMLAILGAVMLFSALKLWQATGQDLELRRSVLCSSDGTVLCQISDVEHVERGAFAFKPSNGFVLRLREAASLRWAPGLWWRYGRRVGVGGVTPGPQGKIMAEVIAELIAEENS